MNANSGGFIVCDTPDRVAVQYDLHPSALPLSQLADTHSLLYLKMQDGGRGKRSAYNLSPAAAIK